MDSDHKLYEIAYLISQNLDLEGAQNFHQTIKNEVQGLGGLVDEEGMTSKRRLSYPIKKTREAYLAHFRFTLNPERINAFKVKLEDHQILRSLIVHTKRAPITPLRPRIIKPKNSIAVESTGVGTPSPTNEPMAPAANIEAIDKKLEEILGK
jgi:ribosomal protein S6